MSSSIIANHPPFNMVQYQCSSAPEAKFKFSGAQQGAALHVGAHAQRAKKTENWAMALH